MAQYYIAPHHDTNGTPLRCQFLNPIGATLVLTDFTPIAGVCCNDGEPDGKCEPNEARWDKPYWRAILFKLSDKHYYSYNMGGGSQLSTAYGGAVAVGDLDCDGTYSTIYQGIVGHNSGAEGIVNCRVQMNPGFTVANETE